MSSYLLDTDTFGNVSSVVVEPIEWEENNFSTYDEAERQASMNAMGLPSFKQFVAEEDVRVAQMIREYEEEHDMAEARKPFAVYTDGELGERRMLSCVMGVGLHYDERGQEIMQFDEFKVGNAELEDMNSDGDPHQTYKNLVHAGVMSPQYAKELELNDNMQKFGEDWVSPLSSRRTELPELAPSYEVEVMASKWRVTVEQAGEIRDRLLAAKFNYLLFDKEQTIRTWLKARDNDVDGLMSWLDYMVEQMSSLDSEEHLVPEAQMGVELTRREDMLATYMLGDKEDIARFHGLTEEQWAEQGIDRFMNEWRTSYRDDTPSEESDGQIPLLELITATIDGKRFTARQLMNRVRSAKDQRDLGHIAAKAMNAKCDGYVAMNWFWYAYDEHWLALEYANVPATKLAVEAVQNGGRAIQKVSVVIHNNENVLMLLQSDVPLIAKLTREFAKSIREVTRYIRVVVLPPNKGGGDVYDHFYDAEDHVRMLAEDEFHLVEPLMDHCFVDPASDYPLAMKYVIHRPNLADTTYVVFRNSKDAYVLYETN